tara:strand:+ start:81 stop:338 length:258 start_codon:yes stop_codon:yes gene_type:complete
MRAAKVNQLNNIDLKIQELNVMLEDARWNDATEKQIAKLEAREYKACDAGYLAATKMTEAEYDASTFGDTMCMSYEEAIDGVENF